MCITYWLEGGEDYNEGINITNNEEIPENVVEMIIRDCNVCQPLSVLKLPCSLEVLELYNPTMVISNIPEKLEVVYVYKNTPIEQETVYSRNCAKYPLEKLKVG